MDPKEIEPTTAADAAPEDPDTPQAPDGAASDASDAESLTPEQIAARELATAQAKAQQNWDLYLRAAAETENLRRRAERDLAQVLRQGPERLVRELMPVLDSLELALAEHADAADPARAGLELIQQQFLQALTNVGVEPIDPVGAAFDPEWHEAMTTQESAEAAPDSVLSVIQRGYRLNDRLIRPARVVVAKAPEGADE
jgi:molecular chaperone GrpE